MISALCSTVLLGVSSCKENKDSKDLAKEENKEKFEDRDDKKDANFLVAAAESELTEIELAKLAQTRGGAKVKDLGKFLEEKHNESIAKLRELASKKQISIPTTITEKGQDKYDKLSKKDDKDFDKAYIDEVVDLHKDAIDKFEKAGKDAEDTEIRTWANAQLPELNEHLGHAQAAENEEHKDNEHKK